MIKTLPDCAKTDVWQSRVHASHCRATGDLSFARPKKKKQPRD